jgi:hypothetical protein
VLIIHGLITAYLGSIFLDTFWHYCVLSILGTVSISYCLSHLDYTRIASSLVSLLYIVGFGILWGVLQQNAKVDGMAFVGGWTVLVGVVLPMVTLYLIMVRSPMRTLNGKGRSVWLVPVAILMTLYGVLLAGMPPWHLFLMVWS